MRLIRAAAALLLVLGAGVAGAVLTTGPAYAGGWAATVLDPVPDRFEPGRSYTIGFWVLQHGSHPYAGTLDPVALQLVAPSGAVTTFPGVALPEPAHYVTSIHLPAAGEYAVVGQQGIFQQFRVGTLTVPGALTVLPVPSPMPWPAEKLPWKEIRPPAVPVDAARQPYDQTAATAPARAATPATATAAAPAPDTTRTASESMRPTTTVLAVIAGLAVILGLLLYRRRGVSSRS
jgi:hypothetical protein